MAYKELCSFPLITCPNLVQFLFAAAGKLSRVVGLRKWTTGFFRSLKRRVHNKDAKFFRMSAQESSARQRKPTESKEDSLVCHEGKLSDKRGGESEEERSFQCSSNVYSKFVDSLERSLAAVVVGDGRPEPRSPLTSLSLEGIADFIKRVSPENVIVMSGAGISTSAGIPDFRSPGTGLYDNMAQYNLSEPQDIFDLDFFHENPKPFFTLAKELFCKSAKPTPCHFFVRLLEKKGLLRRWYTQNIDSLEYDTGISPAKVVTAHGSHRVSTCTKCKKKYDLVWLQRILEDKNRLVALCDNEECGGVVKPDIVFFGENLPERFFRCVFKDFPSCDLLIIMGTSLKVQPFAGLIDEVGGRVPRLLINLEATGQWGVFDRNPMAHCYPERKTKRDVFWKGNCDEGCMKLASLLGWEEELERMVLEGPPSSKLL